MTFEVQQVDAIWYDDGWNYSQTWKTGAFQTKAKNLKKAFTRFLRKKGIEFKKSRTIIEDYGDIIEILDRKTKEPLFCAIYKEG